MQDLALHNCLGYSYFGRSLWEFTDASGQHASVPVGGNLSANESQVLHTAMLDGLGIGLQPVYAVAGALARGELQVVLADWRPASLGIHGIYATRRQSGSAVGKSPRAAREQMLNSRGFTRPKHMAYPAKQPASRWMHDVVPALRPCRAEAMSQGISSLSTETRLSHPVDD